MSSWRQQARIEAPIETVWELIGDPNRYPEWAANVVEVTGLPSVEKGASYEQVGRPPWGSPITTTFVVEELEDLHEIQLRCTKTGYYSHWLLTPADDATFADVEIGMDATKLGDKAFDRTLGKRWYRSLVTQALDKIKEVTARERPRH